MLRKEAPRVPDLMKYRAEDTARDTHRLTSAISDDMAREGARILRRFYRQPFDWLAEYHARKIFEAMLAVQTAKENLVNMMAIHVRFQELARLKNAGL